MEFKWYTWLAISSLAICIMACIWHFFRLVRVGRGKDYSRQAGEVPPAVRYAFTGAMSPARKESALLHLPTYFAGLIYHFGTFLSLFLFIFILTGHSPEGTLAWVIAGFFTGSGIAGISVFIRRLVKRKIRSLSNPDDYISNALVTCFQLLSAAVILLPYWEAVYFIEFSLLMLYLPVGKLKHTVYFFAARYYLGLFYGWRGVWPPGKLNA